jgi:hypothetical protein
MWNALFIITIMTSIGFALAAVVSSQALGARCRDLSRIAGAGFEAERTRSSEAPVQIGEAEPIDAASVTLTAFLEPALLPRRMRRLQIDLDEIFCTEPLLFRELATRCRQCPNTAQCDRDLCDPSASPFDDDWKEYCRNAAILSTISTLRVGSQLLATPDTTPSSMSSEQDWAVVRH